MWYVLLVVFLVLFIRSRFWVQQPVRHFYDLQLGAMPPTKRHVDLLHVNTTYDTADPDLLPFIKNNSDNYYPNDDDVTPFFHRAWISKYVDSTVKGLIVSRPVHISCGESLDGIMHEYMITTDAVTKPLFCTHAYNTPSPSLFSSDVYIPWITPVVVAPIHWIKTSPCKHKARWSRVDSSNFRNFADLIRRCGVPFSAVPPADVLYSYLSNKVYSAYLVLDDDPVAAIVFKKTAMLHDNANVLDCIAVVQPVPHASTHPAFFHIISRFKKQYPVVRVYGLRDAPPVTPFLTTHRRVYMHGYYAATYSPKDCLIL